MALKTVLLIGSAPDAVQARSYHTGAIDKIVAINNAWRVRDDWDYLVHPDDFPADRRPAPAPGQTLVGASAYVPANNVYGGIIYAGATMAFTAAYWVLHTLKPDLLLFTGCDMIYDRKLGPTHFYGNGAADPLRKDPTLQSLEAKTTRLMVLAAQQGCVCANLSNHADTRLTFARLKPTALNGDLSAFQQTTLTMVRESHDEEKIQAALKQENDLGYFIQSGDYWNADIALDEKSLSEIDMRWHQTTTKSQTKAKRSA